MTDQADSPVRELLPDTFDRMPEVIRQAASKDLGVAQGSFAWRFVGEAASKQLLSVLDLDVFEVVAEGWCTARELAEYANLDKHPRDERSVVYLGKHDFVKILHPALDIMVGPKKIDRLRFTLELAAHVRAIALTIQAGHILSMGGGDGSVSATLKYGEATLHSKQSKAVALPVHRDFKKPGLAIA